MFFFWLAAGYVLAVFFPVPGLSRKILDGWKWIHDEWLGHPKDDGQDNDNTAGA